MRLLLNALKGAALALSLSLAAPAFALEGREIADSAGRVVLAPAEPQRVFAAGPPASTLLYVLKPEAMVGWVRAPRPGDLPYLRESVRSLPELGRLTGRGDTTNLEVLLAARPDLILDYGAINDSYRELADRVQEQSGVPYALIDGSFANLPQAIREMAAILNVPERGETLAAYAEATFAEIDALLAQIPEDQRPRVYLARGPEGLESPARGSINAEIVERVGGINVVEAETRGLATVSPEQIQAWAPDVVVTLDADFAASVGAAPEWRGVPAAANGRVYLAPSQPFGFIDFPPSVNRLIGLKWLAHKLYPEQAQGDLRAEVAEFYSLFYGVDLDEAALTALLGE